MMILCQCGCGNECKNKFVHGHNGRGVPRSQDEIKKLKASLNSPEIKQKHLDNIKASWTEEKKQHHSKINLGKTLSTEHRGKIGLANNGKIRTDDVKGRISNSLKGRFVGELNPFYKHGKSNNNKIARQTFEYSQWRKLVFKRDNYTCQDCGVSGIYVTAHHIKSFAYYPELRYEISNGKTLCESCHSKTDNYKKRLKNKLLTIKT